jgi:hypothetical protein
MLLGPLKPLLDLMDSDQAIGLMGCAIYDDDMNLYPYKHHFPNIFSELYKLTIMSVKDVSSLFTSHKRNEPVNVACVDWVEGCFMLTRRDILNRAGCMDEGYFLYYEDIDLCYSIEKRLGMKVVYYPYTKVVHSGSKSTNFSDALHLQQYYASCVRYFSKHRGTIYAAVFSMVCISCWIILFTVVGLSRLVFPKAGRLRRKHDMLITALKKAIGDAFKVKSGAKALL